MRWVAFGALALTVSIIGLLLKIRDDIDRMMFVPRPRDREAMSRALADRFGARVAILDLPVVNRDVNGYGARVRTSVPPGLYVTEAHAFSFERIGGQDV